MTEGWARLAHAFASLFYSFFLLGFSQSGIEHGQRLLVTGRQAA